MSLNVNSDSSLKNNSTTNELKNILPFIIIILLIFGWAHYVVFNICVRSLEETYLKNIFGLVLILGLISMPLGFFASASKKFNFSFLIWSGYIWMGFFNFIFFFSLIELVFSGFFNHPYSFWILPASTVISVWSLYKGLSNPILITHKLKNNSLKGFKIVQISDLHVGMLHLNEKWLSKIVDRINQLNPNVIAITGDLVEGEYHSNSPKLDVLKSLNSTSKKFYITGNHEYLHGAGPWEQKLRELNFTTLHNQNEILNYNSAQILIAGVPDRMIGRFLKNKKSLPDLALKNNIPSDSQINYKILLTHQPSSVFDLKTESCDLILSGHTHGGQIFPFHLLVRLFHPVISGFKVINNILVFAHQGTGLWGPPMRWFSRSEIVLIEWE